MLERVASCFGLSLVIIVKAEHGRLNEGVEGPSLFFGGASRASCSVDETADAAHLQKFILLGIRDVFVDLRNEFGANTLFDTSQNAERVGDGRFFTLTTCPSLIIWLGFTLAPSTVTRLFLIASTARERVL